MKIKFSVLIVLFCFTILVAQENTTPEFELFPAGMNFMPLKANHQEARIGVLYYTASTNLKVDIGNNIDLFGLNFNNSGARLTAGIEFMAYALSTSYKGNRLQIDAVDGFFGGNVSYSYPVVNDSSSMLLARLRILHNSAHFVDGHYDMSIREWINNIEPIPYTEDFGELTVAHELKNNWLDFRYYAGFLYSTLVRPSNLKRYNAHAGFELAFTDLPGKTAGKETSLFLSNFVSTDGADKYIVNQNSMLGVKFGSWNGKGLLLYMSYYSGGDIFGAYFKKRISKFGIGFSVDFL